jgi:hypothetical protein
MSKGLVRAPTAPAHNCFAPGVIRSITASSRLWRTGWTGLKLTFALEGTEVAGLGVSWLRDQLDPHRFCSRLWAVIEVPIQVRDASAYSGVGLARDTCSAGPRPVRITLSADLLSCFLLLQVPDRLNTPQHGLLSGLYYWEVTTQVS